MKDTSPLSLTVKTTDTLKPFSYHEWLQETSRLHRYGMTLPRYAEPTFQGSILSTEDFHAKTFLLRDAELAWKESEAVYSSRSLGSLARYDRDSYSWRTYQRSLFEEQNELLGSFAAYGMTVDGEFYPLRMWERSTGEIDGGCWATPNARDGKDLSRTKAFLAARERHSPSLATIALINGLEWTNVVSLYENAMGYAFSWTEIESTPSVTQWFRPKREKPLKG